MQKALTYEFYKESADYLLKRLPQQPETAIILGTSLGDVANIVEDPLEIEYKDVPNFLVSTVEEHASKFVFGFVKGRYTAVMSGRFHHYEGYDFAELATPVRVLKLLGVKRVIITNISGAINTDYQVGDIMMIQDHIQFSDACPMRGPNIPEFGVRSFEVNEMYTPALREVAKEAAKAAGLDAIMREGVYFYCPGPQLETPAEVRALRILGGDAAGMSTVTEALTAAHCGVEVLGLAFMCNMAAGVLQGPVMPSDFADIMRLGNQNMGRLIEEVMARLGTA